MGTVVWTGDDGYDGYDGYDELNGGWVNGIIRSWFITPLWIGRLRDKMRFAL